MSSGPDTPTWPARWGTIRAWAHGQPVTTRALTRELQDALITLRQTQRTVPAPCVVTADQPHQDAA